MLFSVAHKMMCLFFVLLLLFLFLLPVSLQIALTVETCLWFPITCFSFFPLFFYPALCFTWSADLFLRHATGWHVTFIRTSSLASILHKRAVFFFLFAAHHHATECKCRLHFTSLALCIIEHTFFFFLQLLFCLHFFINRGGLASWLLFFNFFPFDLDFATARFEDSAWHKKLKGSCNQRYHWKTKLKTIQIVFFFS